MTNGLVSLDVSGCLVHRALADGTLAVYYSPSYPSIVVVSACIKRGSVLIDMITCKSTDYRGGYIALSWEVRAS
jgi:hypothetical protein